MNGYLSTESEVLPCGLLPQPSLCTDACGPHPTKFRVTAVAELWQVAFTLKHGVSRKKQVCELMSLLFMWLPFKKSFQQGFCDSVKKNFLIRRKKVFCLFDNSLESWQVQVKDPCNTRLGMNFQVTTTPEVTGAGERRPFPDEFPLENFSEKNCHFLNTS